MPIVLRASALTPTFGTQLCKSVSAISSTTSPTTPTAVPVSTAPSSLMPLCRPAVSYARILMVGVSSAATTASMTRTQMDLLAATAPVSLVTFGTM